MKNIQDLSKILVELGKKRHGSDYAYSFALGSITGLVDFYLRYYPEKLADVVNERYLEAEKELAQA
jgi:hypothetical protein